VPSRTNSMISSCSTTSLTSSIRALVGSECYDSLDRSVVVRRNGVPPLFFCFPRACHVFALSGSFPAPTPLPFPLAPQTNRAQKAKRLVPEFRARAARSADKAGRKAAGGKEAATSRPVTHHVLAEQRPRLRAQPRVFGDREGRRQGRRGSRGHEGRRWRTRRLPG